MGPHLTLCYKDENQLLRGTHVASHGYVNGKNDTALLHATHAGEKKDSAKRQRGTKTVWPAENGLEAVPDVGYSHFPAY